MFLVLIRHPHDDLPVKLCPTIEQAREFAKTLDSAPRDDMQDLFKVDISDDAICVVVIPFDEAGNPVSVLKARDFEKESNEAAA